jgi:hypothetical protein
VLHSVALDDIGRVSGENVNDKGLRVLASVGLAVGGVFGIAGTFASSPSLRGLAWGIDGVGLIMAGAVLTLVFYRKGQDVVASGFLVFAVGEGIILSGAAMDLTASVPSFGAGTSLWALALVLISNSARVSSPRAPSRALRRGPLRSYRRADLRGRADHADDIPIAVLRISSARSNAGRLDLDTCEGRQLDGMRKCRDSLSRMTLGCPCG